MASSIDQTTKWVAGIVGNHTCVTEARVIGAQQIRISREEYEPFVAAIVSVDVVSTQVVLPLLEASAEIGIVVNVPKESVWTGPAIATATAHGSASGGIRDLLAVAGRQDVGRYVRDEYVFVERGLNQHDRVSSFNRVYDRAYRIHRHLLPSLNIVILNEYELTGDHVRTARERYGGFGAIVITNPNGKATSSAISVASHLGASILKWSAFLGRLNRV